MKYPIIQEIMKIENLRLIVKFSDGTIKGIDFHSLLNNPVFEPLEEFTFFKQVKIDKGGYGLVWDENIDISESYLWDNGKIVTKIVA